MKDSKISWTDHSFNPWRGCLKVSPACAFCYAEREVNRYSNKDTRSELPGGDFANKRTVASEQYWKQPIKWNRAAAGYADLFHCIRNMNDDGQPAICRTIAENFECDPDLIDNRLFEMQQLGMIDWSDALGIGNGYWQHIDYSRQRVFCASWADVFEDWDGPMLNSKGERLWWPPDAELKGLHWVPIRSNLETNIQNLTRKGYKPVTMSDVRRRLFRLIDATPNLDWLLLTKRPENILKMWRCPRKPYGNSKNDPSGRFSNLYRPNVWLGTTAENQQAFNKRSYELTKCRELSPVLWISCEPLLETIDISIMNHTQHSKVLLSEGYIDWVIAGGESGSNARSTPKGAFESLMDQCLGAGVPFHFKQLSQADYPNTFRDFDTFPEHLKIREFPKV